MKSNQKIRPIYNKPELEALYTSMTEHEHQRELFSWAAAVNNYGWDEANLWAQSHPMTHRRDKGFFKGRDRSTYTATDLLKWLHAIPNGGSRGGNRSQRQREGARMRSEGVRKGIPDIFLPKPVGGLSGLYIELKKVKGGRLGVEQAEFAAYARGEGYAVALCRGYWEAIGAIGEYLSYR